MILLDTNALSEPLKKRPEASFLKRLADQPADSLATSVVCVFELRHGALRGPDADRRWDRIARDVLARVTVLPVDYDVAIRAAEILADSEAAGTPIGMEDLLIGATALVRGCTVVTRNVRHVSRIPGLRIADWWT